MAADLDWNALGEVNGSPVHYRKWSVYALKDKINVADAIISGAPYGGPIAAILSTGAGRPGQGSVPGQPPDPMELRIYSSSGTARRPNHRKGCVVCGHPLIGTPLAHLFR